MTKTLKREDVSFFVTIEPEPTSIKHAFASGDDATDREMEEWVEDQLQNGNEWAWCDVTVTASTKGFHEYGSASLGCCSYESMTDFIQEGTYYKDLCDEAFENLLEKLEAEEPVTGHATHFAVLHTENHRDKATTFLGVYTTEADAEAAVVKHMTSSDHEPQSFEYQIFEGKIGDEFWY